MKRSYQNRSSSISVCIATSRLEQDINKVELYSRDKRLLACRGSSEIRSKMPERGIRGMGEESGRPTSIPGTIPNYFHAQLSLKGHQFVERGSLSSG